MSAAEGRNTGTHRLLAGELLEGVQPSHFRSRHFPTGDPLEGLQDAFERKDAKRWALFYADA